MRVVFMGTPDFAVPSLRALAHAHDVVAVYTRPDAASGRGTTLRPTPVKEAALELGLTVLQPLTLKDDAEVAALAALEPDVVVVAAYGLILPQAVLDVPALGCVNVHASLLPRWRGAAPIQRAILAGDAVTGVSIMRMEAGLDTGPFCATIEVPVDDLDTPALTTLLAESGARALVEALPAIAEGTAAWALQIDEQATYAAKIAKADVALSPELTALDAIRRVRAANAAAPARASLGGRAVTVLGAALSDGSLSAGEAASSKSGVTLGFSEGALLVTRVRPEGKGEMDAAAWARGVRDLSELGWKGLS